MKISRLVLRKRELGTALMADYTQLSQDNTHLTKWCWCDHNNLITTSTTSGRRSRLSFVRHRNGVKSKVMYFFKVKPGWDPSKISLQTMLISFWPQKFSHLHSRKELPTRYEACCLSWPRTCVRHNSDLSLTWGLVAQTKCATWNSWPHNFLHVFPRYTVF